MNQNLPASPQVVNQYAMMNLSPQNPPCSLNVDLSLYNDAIKSSFNNLCGLLACEIQSLAGSNPIATFTFNMCSNNRWQNNDYVTAVMGYLDYISIMMNYGNYNDFVTCVNNTIKDYVGMFSSTMIMNYPALGQYLDQNSGNYYNQAANEFNRVIPMIQQWKQEKMNALRSFGIGSNFGGNNFGQQNFGNMGNGNSGASSRTYGNAEPTGLFSDNKIQVNNQQTSNSLRDFGSPNQSRADVVAEALSGTPVQTAVPKEVKWVPSEAYPYIPAYNPCLMTLKLEYDQTKKVVPVLNPIERNLFMQYADHVKADINSIFGPLSSKVDFSQASVLSELLEVNSSMSTHLNEIKEVIEEDENVLNGDISIYVNPNIGTDVSLHALWTAGSVERMTRLKKDGFIPMVYRRYAFLSDVVITEKDYSDFIVELSKSKTFIELREKIKANEESIPVNLYSEINSHVTFGINNIISQNLSIAETSIDSFVEDIDALIKHIGDTFGDRILRIFLSNQEREIGKLFQILDAHVKENLDSWYIEEDAKDQPAVNHLTKLFSLTYINCRAKELQLQMVPGISNVLTESAHPEFYNLVNNIFIDADLRYLSKAFHLIRTNDGRIIEARKGYLVDDAIVITLVK